MVEKMTLRGPLDRRKRGAPWSKAVSYDKKVPKTYQNSIFQSIFNIETCHISKNFASGAAKGA